MSAISNEIQRQMGQKFLEPKFGQISPNFSFEIQLANYPPSGSHSKNLLSIKREGLVYRIRQADEYTGMDGSGLKSQPAKAYDPFYKLINGIVPIIGSDGKASYSKFESTSGWDGPGWAWGDQRAKSLEEALDKYRFAKFSYESPKGINLFFYPESDPNKNKGDLSLQIPLKGIQDIDFKDIKLIEEASDYLQKFSYELTSKLVDQLIKEKK